MNCLYRASLASLAMVLGALAQAQTAPDNSRQNTTDSVNKTCSADVQKNDKAATASASL